MSRYSDPRRLPFRAWLRRQRHRDDPVGELARLDAETDCVPWFVPRADLLADYLGTHTAMTDAEATEHALAAWSAYLDATDSQTQPPPAA